MTPLLSHQSPCLHPYNLQVEELDSEMRNHVAQELLAKDINLEVYGVGDGAPARSDEAAEYRVKNMEGVHELIAQVNGTYKALPSEVDMIAMFPTRETAGTASNQLLKIGSNCNIEVGQWVSPGLSCSFMQQQVALATPQARSVSAAVYSCLHQLVISRTQLSQHTGWCRNC